MTDNEIIKALEHIESQTKPLIISSELLDATLNCMKLQQAEIERLKKSVDIHKGIAEDWKHEANRLKEMVGEE